LVSRGYYFQFGSVFIKKKNYTKKNIFFKKPKPIQTDRFWFGSVFHNKNRFKPVWLCFFCFFCLGSVRFFRFQAYKTKIKPVGFFKILIGLICFFSRFSFFSYFFSNFLGLINFLIFLLIFINYSTK
jgi:hypothetical protein